MNDLIRHRLETPRHATEWLEAGPADGRLMIFLHGLPGFSIIWRRQLDELAAAGWRCVAPDMRGYGGSAHRSQSPRTPWPKCCHAALVERAGAFALIFFGAGPAADG